LVIDQAPAAQVVMPAPPPLPTQELETRVGKETSLAAPFIKEQEESLLFELGRLEKQVTSYQESHGMLGRQSDKGFSDDQLEQALEQRLTQVRNALSRIEVGGYGLCQRCGGQIELDRLEAVPSTPFCL